MIPVNILGIHLDPLSGATIVFLAEVNEVTKVLPIVVGPAEAEAIALGLGGAVMSRPGTHDLLIDVVDSLHSRVTEVAVTELRDGTFFGEIEIATGNERTRVSSRPSDGIALATRLLVPLYVSADVLNEAGVEIVHERDMPLEPEEIEQVMTEFEEFMRTAKPADFDPDRTAETGNRPEAAGLDIDSNDDGKSQNG